LKILDLLGKHLFIPLDNKKKRKINFMDKMTEGYKDEKISCVAASCSNVFSRGGGTLEKY
jgi:hypothetical protein